jgi:hypothetical protein
MNSIKLLVRHNRLQFAIILFLILFTMIHNYKPSLIYELDGSFRKFGVGYKNNTVVPIWLISIICAILSYVAVSFYLANT